MAEIPLTKKSGGRWWLWLLIIVILIALVWWWLGGREAPDDVVPRSAEAEMDAPLPVLTDLTDIRGVQDPDSLQGRRADLNGVTVGSVVGDRGFTIDDGEGNSLFVVLDQVATPNTPTEGRYDINSGQVIDVEGEIRGVIDGMVEGEAIEDMPRGTQIYLFAQRADIEERP